MCAHVSNRVASCVSRSSRKHYIYDLDGRPKIRLPCSNLLGPRSLQGPSVLCDMPLCAGGGSCSTAGDGPAELEARISLRGCAAVEGGRRDMNGGVGPLLPSGERRSAGSNRSGRLTEGPLRTIFVVVLNDGESRRGLADRRRLELGLLPGEATSPGLRLVRPGIPARMEDDGEWSGRRCAQAQRSSKAELGAAVR